MVIVWGDRITPVLQTKWYVVNQWRTQSGLPNRTAGSGLVLTAQGRRVKVSASNVELRHHLFLSS